MQISEGYAAIHGFPERTAEIARSECLATVHPDDIAQVKRLRSEAFHEQRREYNVEYRIIRPSDEIRWVETRCFISYDAVGDPKRVVGVSIDITERKAGRGTPTVHWLLSSTIALRTCSRPLAPSPVIHWRPAAP